MIRFLILGIISLFFLNVTCWGADWRLYSENQMGTYYYDVASIKHISKRDIQVLIRDALTPEGVVSFKKASRKEYNDLSYYTELNEINCTGQMIRTWGMTCYDHNGSA